MVVWVTVLAAAFGVAWPWALRGARSVVDGMSRARGLRWLVGRAWRIPAILAALSLTALTVVAFLARQVVASLPWHEEAPLVGLGFGVSIAAWPPLAPAWLRRGTLGLTVLVFAAAFVAALRLRKESSAAQKSRSIAR